MVPAKPALPPRQPAATTTSSRGSDGGGGGAATGEMARLEQELEVLRHRALELKKVSVVGLSLGAQQIFAGEAGGDSGSCCHPRRYFFSSWMRVNPGCSIQLLRCHDISKQQQVTMSPVEPRKHPALVFRQACAVSFVVVVVKVGASPPTCVPPPPRPPFRFLTLHHNPRTSISRAHPQQRPSCRFFFVSL